MRGFETPSSHYNTLFFACAWRHPTAASLALRPSLHHLTWASRARCFLCHVLMLVDLGRFRQLYTVQSDFSQYYYGWVVKKRAHAP